MTQPTTRPQYLVTADFGKLGHGYVNEPEDTRATVIDMIAVGEWKVVSVLELLPADEPGKPGAYNDITEDIAREVRDCIHNEGHELTDAKVEWLEKHLGLNATRGMRRAA